MKSQNNETGELYFHPKEIEMESPFVKMLKQASRPMFFPMDADTIEAKLSQIEALDEDHDGYGSLPPNHQVIMGARSLIAKVLRLGLTPSRILALAGKGGVEVVYRSGEKVAMLTFRNSGESVLTFLKGKRRVSKEKFSLADGNRISQKVQIYLP